MTTTAYSPSTCIMCSTSSITFWPPRPTRPAAAATTRSRITSSTFRPKSPRRAFPARRWPRRISSSTATRTSSSETSLRRTPISGVPGTALAPPDFIFDGNQNLIVRNFIAPNAAGVDAVMAQGAVSSPAQPDTDTWMLTDNLGSLRIVLDNSSNVVDEVVYNAIGVIAHESNPSIGHFAGFAGGHVDQNTGLVNDYHRWYDPTTERWNSDDPEGFAAGDSNLSRYVRNSSTNYND